MAHDISSLPKESPSKIEKIKTSVAPHLKKLLIGTAVAAGFIAVGYAVAKSVSPDEVEEDFIIVPENDSDVTETAEAAD